MPKSILQVASALVACTNAATIGQNDSIRPPDAEDQPDFSIVYPDGLEDLIDLEPWRYPESFAWGRWCSATMISPRVALTAAHCVFDGMDGVNPRRSNGSKIDVTLTNSDPNGPDFTTYIQEIRSNECWYENKFFVVWGGDLAMLILEDEKPGAVRGVDYIDIWDNDVDGDITGRTFALMGWGYSGPVSNPRQGIWDFHRGYNVVRRVYENRIQYGFEDPAQTGLPLESVANNGDSGGAATIELTDGSRKLIGVCSNGYGPYYR